VTPAWQPKDLERLILRAALAQGDDAVQAWREYYRRTELEDMPMSSFRLMGLVHSHMTALGYTGPEMGRIKGIRRKLWLEGEQLVFRCLPLLAELKRICGRVIVLKGAPMAALYYRDFGLRPMADVDILVPEETALTAMDWLLAQGFTRSIHPQPIRVDREFLSFRHGANFEKGPIALDLHWHVSNLATRPAADRRFWRDAEPFPLKGLELETLSAEGHLLHALVHGVLFNPFPAFRWVADAATILRSRPNFDWSRFQEYSHELDLAAFAAPGLRFLRDEFDEKIPDTVLTAEPKGFTGRAEFACLTKPATTQGPAAVIAGAWRQYRRTGGAMWQPGRMSRYFRFIWNLRDLKAARRSVAHWRGNRAGRPAA